MGRPPSYDRDTALNSAMLLFWRHGYQGTSLKDLENGLSMRPGSIYAAFHSKEALYRECLARYDRIIRAKLDEIVSEQDTAFSSMVECLLFLADLSAREHQAPCMLTKTLLEAARDGHGPEMFVDDARELMNGVEDFLSTLVAQAQKDQEIENDVSANVVARRLHSAVIGLQIQQHLNPNANDRERSLREDLLFQIDPYRVKLVA